ncbi:hypothetical protein FDECE_7653 [Fusarium decemcellulare]|nr:hypothetical protein FDECE_7653 [Fusarium decemcellulare]
MAQSTSSSGVGDEESHNLNTTIPFADLQTPSIRLNNSAPEGKQLNEDTHTVHKSSMSILRLVAEVLGSKSNGVSNSGIASNIGASGNEIPMSDKILSWGGLLIVVLVLACTVIWPCFIVTGFWTRGIENHERPLRS